METVKCSPGTAEKTDKIIHRMRQIGCLVALALPVLLCQNVSAADKPNIVYILVDNWGWGDISAQGGTCRLPISITSPTREYA